MFCSIGQVLGFFKVIHEGVKAMIQVLIEKRHNMIDFDGNWNWMSENWQADVTDLPARETCKTKVSVQLF